MQLFIRTLRASTETAEVERDATVASLKYHIAATQGIPAEDQVLIHGIKILNTDDTALSAFGISQHSTIHLSCRLRGGKPVKVKMLTPHLPCGPEVTIDIEPNATKDEIKHKLAPVTGVPVEHQKVMLSGINQIVMGDKRTNIGFSACGSTNGVQLAVGK